jgi:hypothetical protein
MSSRELLSEAQRQTLLAPITGWTAPKAHHEQEFYRERLRLIFVLQVGDPAVAMGVSWFGL